MNTIGIIAEYNPFHNGHRYQIRQIKALTGAQNVVAAMSGDFVQRGTPAWTDKYLRTQMALSQGIDMVFELPVSFSTSSAEAFARAGVALLTSLKFVDGICFGSECDNLPLLWDIAAFLANPSNSFEETIRKLTASGLSYPTARQQALSLSFASAVKEYPDLFTSPNNILALEYLKAIKQQNSPLIPYLIPRKGAGYHSSSLKGSFASATAIRKASLSDRSTIARSPKEAFLAHIAAAIPSEILELLQENQNRYPVTENHFSSLLYYRLAHLTDGDTAILDMTEDILHRLRRNLSEFTNYADYTAKIKTKQYTYSRISRVLLHCLLDITALWDNTLPFPYTPYTRLLGFHKEKSHLLRISTGIPVITKPADGLSQIHAFYSALIEEQTAKAPSALIETGKNYIDYSCSLYKKDIFASNLYCQIQNTALGCNRHKEYYNQPVII